MTQRPATRRALFAALLALVLLCAASASRSETRKRAVLISFDGVSGLRLQELLADPKQLTSGGFRRVAERGFVADRSVPPSPALTAVSHITIATGALPDATGIVSNMILDRSKPFGSTVSGFDAPIRADTLWEAARRQGKRVGIVLFPGADGTTPSRTADWGLNWPGSGVVKAKLHALDLAAWRPVAAASEKSFSPARQVDVPLGAASWGMGLTALDSSDDGKVDYDHLRVSSPIGAPQDVRPGDWFPVEIGSPEGRTGAWCKLLSLAPDLSKVEVYVGAFGRNKGYPKAFVSEIDERFGFWPGAGDHDTFDQASEHPEALLEQLDRLAAYITRVQVWAVARSDWDLLLLYQPQVDAISHEFWMVDAGQPGFSWAKAERYRGLVDRGYGLADRSLDAIERALRPDDAIFVTSDHGMTAVWVEIYVNELLRRGGFVKVDAKRRIDPSSSAVAIVETGIAHVYRNPQADASVLDRVEALLSGFRVRGESPWEQIVRRDKAGPLHLDAPESGDLILFARPGVRLLRAVPEREAPLDVPVELGAHGYWNVHPEVHACFLSAGPGIAKGRVESINSWQIAARVAAALGIDPPRNASR